MPSKLSPRETRAVRLAMTPMDPAPLWRRIAAFMVDYVVIAAYLSVLTLVAFRVPWVSELFRTPASGHAMGFLVLTLPVALYLALSEASRHGASPGKRALGIAVVGTDTVRLGLGRSLVRTGLKLLPWELAHALIWRVPGWPHPQGEVPSWLMAGMAVVWLLVLTYLATALISRRGQALYDRVASTVVVRTTSGP